MARAPHARAALLAALAARAAAQAPFAATLAVYDASPAGRSCAAEPVISRAFPDGACADLGGGVSAALSCPTLSSFSLRVCLGGCDATGECVSLAGAAGACAPLAPPLLDLGVRVTCAPTPFFWALAGGGAALALLLACCCAWCCCRGSCCRGGGAPPASVVYLPADHPAAIDLLWRQQAHAQAPRAHGAYAAPPDFASVQAPPPRAFRPPPARDERGEPLLFGYNK